MRLWIRELVLISMILDSEFWGEIPRVTEQDDLVIISILDRRYSESDLTQQDTKITNKNIWTCKATIAEMDFSDLVCNIYGGAGNIPSNMSVFAYYPYGARARIEYWRHKNISRFNRGGKDVEEQKTKDRIDKGRDGRELHNG